MTANWTEQDFIKRTGRKPDNDDLERVNCPDEGKIGHKCCGICEKHQLPYFMCNECITSRFEKEI